MFLKIKDLPVSQFMTGYPISVKSTVSFKTVVDFMSERGFGNLVVAEEEKPIGVFTEREVLRHIVSNDAKYETPIKEIGMQKFQQIDPGISVLDAARIMFSKNSRLLVFINSEKLVGIITATDMLRAFRQTDDDPPIAEFISENLVKCNSKTSIKEAAKIMQDKGVGSVILGDIAYYGIITERDILHVLREKIPLTNSIGNEGSSPLVKAEDSISAKGAARVMAANNIKRLGLTHNENLTGMITALDLVNAYQQSSGASHVSHWDEVKG